MIFQRTVVQRYFVTGEHGLFFGMFFSTPFAPKIVISGDSPGKLFRLFLSLRSTIPENKIILFGILNVYSEK